jgi:hypothetical protein
MNLAMIPISFLPTLWVTLFSTKQVLEIFADEELEWMSKLSSRKQEKIRP